MRNKRTYTKTIAISEVDLKYIESLRKGNNSKKSKAGILSMIIINYKQLTK